MGIWISSLQEALYSSCENQRNGYSCLSLINDTVKRKIMATTCTDANSKLYRLFSVTV